MSSSAMLCLRADTISAVEAFAFQAVLVPYAPFVDWPAEPVVRTIAVREDQTLEQLHEALRIAGWADAHTCTPSG